MHNLAFSLTAAGLQFSDIINYFLSIINILNPILFTLAFLVFFWGLSKFILSSGNKDEVAKGKDYMLYGIAALFILLSFMAILTLVSNNVGLGPNANPNGVLPTNVTQTNSTVNVGTPTNYGN